MLLAAGRGERFGTATKQLVELDGRPLIAHAVAAAAAGGVDRLVVVVGHDADRVGAAARAAGADVGVDVEVVDNPDHAAGQSTSLRAGVAALAGDQDVEVAVLLLADQPGVTGPAVRSVAAAVRQDRVDAARACYVDGVGHPVAFARAVLPRLASAAGDVGARHLLDDLEVAPVLVGGTVPADVDTPDDLARLAGGAASAGGEPGGSD